MSDSVFYVVLLDDREIGGGLWKEIRNMSMYQNMIDDLNYLGEQAARAMRLKDNEKYKRHKKSARNLKTTAKSLGIDADKVFQDSFTKFSAMDFLDPFKVFR